MKRTILALATVVALALAPTAAVAQSKISALPAGSAVGATDVFPATQGSCPSSCATNGVTGAQIKTWAQSGLSASSLSNGVTGSGAVVLVTSPTLVTPTLGVATVTTIAGKNAISSVVAGAAALTSPTVACAASHVCDSLSGEISLATGTGSPATGTLFTISFADTRTNIPNCIVQVRSTVGINGNSYHAVATTSTLVMTADTTAFTSSTTFAADYICGGK